MWHCMASYCKKVAHCSGYKSVQSGSEADLLDALYTVGPLRFTHTCMCMIVDVQDCAYLMMFRTLT